MKIEVEVGCRTRTVEIGQGQVTVDGRVIAVDLARAGQRWSLLLGADGPRTSYEVAVTAKAGGEAIVYVDGRPVPVVIGGAAARFGAAARRGAAGQASAHGAQRVLAPMPGRIVQMLVAVGDVVAARQGLVVIEAMKMENELRAPKAGTVTEVRVKKGASVEAHAVLVIVE